MSKVKKDYPEWNGLTYNLDDIFNELIENWIDVYDLNVSLQEKDFFERIRKKD